MSSNLPIYYIKDGSLNFADKKLFEDLEIFLYPNDKICLVGKNGSGKSSLFKAITGEYILNTGTVYAKPSLTINYLAQKNISLKAITVYEFVLEDIDKLEDNNQYLADIVLDGLKLDGTAKLQDLSGGGLRRASLAKALVNSPDILLLDEPTNHLDISSIEWLEDFVLSYKGAVVCISHDKSFLKNVTNKLWWLDKGRLRKTDQGFQYFESWQENIIQEEIALFNKLRQKTDEENLWLQQGVTGRRKRNQKRLKDLINLRMQFQNQQHKVKNLKQSIEFEGFNEKIKSKFIIEAEGLSYHYNKINRDLIKNFSIKINKGEKIGLIGPNGCGKTTIIKLLIGELTANSGTIKRGKSLEIAYFDQHKAELKPNETLWETLCPHGGDRVFLPDGRNLHIAAYLKDFLFDPKQLHAKTMTLSGGEASRLMLAKTLAKTSNLLILDEPTNDLDMNSLEILEEILGEYPGTLFIVSHDRDFLERIVTRTLVFKESGEIVDFIGGYEDYKKHNSQLDKLSANKVKATRKDAAVQIIDASNNKLSYKYKHRYEIIPGLIKEIESEIQNFQEKLSDENLYLEDISKFNFYSQELEKSFNKIKSLENEWLEILTIIENQ